ncbi:MAG TPA: hypothetical protein VHJ83_07820, partial [Micromonosporaceae bacterium]|nr:hypothetical protein [Micromonosporaceae bacterium]
NGQPIAITGSRDNTARTWDLNTGQPIGPPLTDHTGPVVAVAALVLPNGQPTAITGSSDNTVRIWDLDTGQPIGAPLTDHTNPVVAVTALVLPNGQPIAITGSADGTVRMWDLARGGAMAYPVLHMPGGVQALAVNTSGDWPVAVVAGDGLMAVTLPLEEP